LPHFFAKKPRHPCEAWDSACYAYVFWLRIATKFAANLRNRVFGGCQKIKDGSFVILGADK